MHTTSIRKYLPASSTKPSACKIFEIKLLLEMICLSLGFSCSIVSNMFRKMSLNSLNIGNLLLVLNFQSTYLNSSKNTMDPISFLLSYIPYQYRLSKVGSGSLVGSGCRSGSNSAYWYVIGILNTRKNCLVNSSTILQDLKMC